MTTIKNMAYWRAKNNVKSDGNYDGGDLKANRTPMKHKDTTPEYEKQQSDPNTALVGGSGRGAKGHSHPHPGMVGSTKGTWNSQDDYVASGNRWDRDEKEPKNPKPRIPSPKVSPNKQRIIDDRKEIRKPAPLELPIDIPPQREPMHTQKHMVLPDYYKVGGADGQKEVWHDGRSGKEIKQLISTTPQSDYYDPTYKRRTKLGTVGAKIANVFRGKKKDKNVKVKKRK